MTTSLSAVIAARPRGGGKNISVSAIDLPQAGITGAAVVVLDHFRLSGQPFTAHPHAGFSAVTYIFDDSESGLRTRDSLGNDFVTDPGGVVWTQAGRGIIHEELPADPERALHGLQLFVNLSSAYKSADPHVLRLTGDQVPTVRTAAGDHIRVLVGRYGGVMSSLTPLEPFTLLDITLHQQISLSQPAGQIGVVYVLDGDAAVIADDGQVQLGAEHAVAVHGDGRLTVIADRYARLLVLAGAHIGEPVVARGPFIMTTAAELDDADARYRRGQMGSLPPLPD